ncbi:histidine phosphatase family protein [Dactylosporangium sp. CA-233914]|uniref:histidine phosphatase family protein n=1 Tax=Dactylosporangium sp. CA-233914 TaxID=3239934 RepID=UPI003D93C2A0
MPLDFVLTVDTGIDLSGEGCRVDSVALATLWGVEHVELVLLRHGHPVPLDERLPAQRDDPPLSGIGIRQSAAVAATFPAGAIDAIYTSDMARARQTADVVAAVQGLSPVVLPDLREIELPDTGSRPPGVAVEQWESAGREFLHSGQWTAFAEIGAVLAFRRRVRQTFDQLVRRHGGTARIVVVCHSGVINRYLADVLPVGRDYFYRPLHASMVRVWCDAHRTVLHSLNETAHLDRELLTG